MADTFYRMRNTRRESCRTCFGEHPFLAYDDHADGPRAEITGPGGGSVPYDLAPLVPAELIVTLDDITASWERLAANCDLPALHYFVRADGTLGWEAEEQNPPPSSGVIFSGTSFSGNTINVSGGNASASSPAPATTRTLNVGPHGLQFNDQPITGGSAQTPPSPQGVNAVPQGIFVDANRIVGQAATQALRAMGEAARSFSNEAAGIRTRICAGGWPIVGEATSDEMIVKGQRAEQRAELRNEFQKHLREQARAGKNDVIDGMLDVMEEEMADLGIAPSDDVRLRLPAFGISFSDLVVGESYRLYCPSAPAFPSRARFLGEQGGLLRWQEYQGPPYTIVPDPAIWRVYPDDLESALRLMSDEARRERGIDLEPPQYGVSPVRRYLDGWPRILDEGEPPPRPERVPTSGTYPRWREESWSPRFGSPPRVTTSDAFLKQMRDMSEPERRRLMSGDWRSSWGSGWVDFRPGPTMEPGITISRDWRDDEGSA